MSQNGQGWSTGGSPGSGEPYAEPADPWGDAATPSIAPWGGRPVSVPPDDPASVNYAMDDPYPLSDPYTAAPLNTPPPIWQQPPTAPAQKRANGPIVAIVVVLGLLICGGLATTAWLVQGSEPSGAGSRALGASAAPTATQAGAAPEPKTSQDARFVSKGQCVRDEGSGNDTTVLTIEPCTTGTYEVLKRVDGLTTGEADAKSKCDKVTGYTNWYFFNSELDSLDFVLCLRQYGSD